MWFLAHAASGAAIGSLLSRRLWLGVLLAFASHAVLDLVPHWDYGTDLPTTYGYAFLDVTAGFFLIYVAARLGGNARAAVLGGLSAALPDLDYVLNDLGLIVQWYYPSHLPAFPHGQAPPGPGILIQLVVVGLALVVTVRRRS